jgi:hypothetical protein
MHVSTSLSTFHGRRLAAEPESLAALLNNAERNRLAAALDREADLALTEGKRILADHLSWRAAGLRSAPETVQ